MWKLGLLSDRKRRLRSTSTSLLRILIRFNNLWLCFHTRTYSGICNSIWLAVCNEFIEKIIFRSLMWPISRVFTAHFSLVCQLFSQPDTSLQLLFTVHWTVNVSLLSFLPDFVSYSCHYFVLRQSDKTFLYTVRLSNQICGLQSQRRSKMSVEFILTFPSSFFTVLIGVQLPSQHQDCSPSW